MPKDRKDKIIFAGVIFLAFLVANVFSNAGFKDIFNKNEDEIVMSKPDNENLDDMKNKETSSNDLSSEDKKVYISGEVKNSGVYDITERVADYEDEQEENAIISYTELLNAVKAKKDVQEELNLSQIKENTPKEEIKIEQVNVVKENKPYDEQKKFHSSEAISPLGRINKSVTDDSYKSNKRPDNMQDEEFLKSLKDFRGNL